uniref:BLISTER n=1 Tax=Kalanchoe fedtschenkoi TaxID=63787 RepID=A0A7N0V4W1_KALFE
MASAQVLPNAAASTARKQELLAAGKRRLEEFRRKKALEKGKNAASKHQSQDASDNQYAQIAHVQPVDSDEADPSSRADETADESLGVISSRSEAVEPVQFNDQGSSNGLQSVPPLPFNNGSPYSNAGQFDTADQDPKVNLAGSYKPIEDYEVTEKDKEIHEESGISDGQQRGHTTSESNYYYQSASHEKKSSSGEVDKYSSFRFNRPASGQNFMTTESPEGSGTSIGKLDSSFSFVPTPYSAPSATSEPLPSNFKSEKSFSDHALTDPAKTQSNSRRSRPSFLDTIKVSSSTPFPSPVQTKQNNTDRYTTLASSNLSNESKLEEALKSHGSSSTDNAFGKSPGFSNSAYNGSYQFSGLSNGNWSEHENTYHSVKQNEDFSALEQHIEDLTQEKFSLRRAIEASRALAESLAAENSALTDSYNQQGSVVNQLKLEMEKLQEDIRGQSAELEAIKNEYGHALLECNAADERAKLLASEVISLEEKALRLRSNELKLERQLETALSEVSSLKKKISSLERERQDLHASIAAFQEEKKLLQSKLRKSSAAGNPNVNSSPSNKKNASTSTDDLVYEDRADVDSTVGSSDTFMHITESSSAIGDLVSSLSHENGEVNLHVGTVSLPADQMGVIQNINALLSELALEKEELIRTLRAESSECTKFKEINKDLSKRLEIQTQRLELLTAQSMAGENVPIRQPDFPSMENPIVYADEGDEVVERVLGWIMKLFPGGPSKRRTSKLI